MKIDLQEIDLQKINTKMITHVNFHKKHRGLINSNGELVELFWSDEKRSKYLPSLVSRPEGFYSEKNSGSSKFYTKDEIMKRVDIVVEDNIVYTKERCEVYAGNLLITVIYINGNDRHTLMNLKNKFSDFIEI